MELIGFRLENLKQWARQCLDNPSPTLQSGISKYSVWFGWVVRFVMQTIRPVLTKGPFEWLTAIQSVEEILNRHIKAASKRLRYQQVERIEISVPHIFGQRQQEVSEWISKFALTHEWNDEHDDVRWCEKNAVPLRELSSKIEYRFAPSLTEKMFTQMLIELPDLFVGTSIDQVASVTGLPLNWMSIRSHRDLKKAIQGCAYVKGTPTQAQLNAFQLQIPVEVKLMTTRGGTWPERREQIVFASDI